MSSLLTLDDLRTRQIEDWRDIDGVLDELAARPPQAHTGPEGPSPNLAFVTFAYDIDGVTLEIAKYGAYIEEILEGTEIHVIGGNIQDKADFVLPAHWRRHRIEGADGWGKWKGGELFMRLFFERMPQGSELSAELAAEIWRQALDLTGSLCRLIDENGIDTLFAVNVNSNPGNLAFALAIVLASEITGCPVLNNNHDFYWEGGKPAAERGPDEAKGPRDHFFLNCDNAPFFQLFRRLLPWNGRRWIQVNINPAQSRVLIDRDRIPPDRVFEIGTAIEDAYFEPCSAEERQRHRLRTARILSGGAPVLRATSLDEFQAGAGDWMTDQRPFLCGAESGLELDLAAPGAVHFLQPTRLIGRKQIWRNWQLVDALLEYGPFRSAFESRPDMTLTVHCTGPVPIEHRADLEDVLTVYKSVLDTAPPAIARRLFAAFTVGNEDHPSLHEDGLGKLVVADFFKMSNVVLFPSQTEGRGLPIPESAAAGVPIVCSRYHPEEVFAGVVGEHLPEEERILHATFPEGEFGKELLGTVTRMILEPESFATWIEHNRRAVRRRYSSEGMKSALRIQLDRLAQTRVD